MMVIAPRKPRITTINAALGLLLASVLWWLGVEDPLLWGAIAGILNFIPFVGPMLVILILTVVGFGHFTTAQLNHYAHTILVGLVAQLADAFKLLLFHQLGNLLDQPRLVQLVRQLGNDDLLATAGLVHIFDNGAGADLNAATTSAIGFDDAGTAVDDRRRREVRTRDVLHQLIDGQFRVIDQR